MDKLKDLLTSTIRTSVVAAVVGLVAWLRDKHGIEIDQDQVTALTTAVEALVSVSVGIVFYVVVRFLETYVNPWFGVLLGAAKAPVYKTADHRRIV